MMLAMVAWLTPIANSKTSLLAMLVGIAFILALQVPTIRKNLWSYVFVLLAVIGIANELFALQGAIFEASGRDATLTGRTDLWRVVLAESNNPIMGAGYASFWLGDRLMRIWAMYPLTPIIQAHNGYIEVYLNLGMIGLILLIGILISGLRNTRARLMLNDSYEHDRDYAVFATFGIAYVLAYLLYNISEATFVGLNLLFAIFLLLAIQYRERGA